MESSNPKYPKTAKFFKEKYNEFSAEVFDPLSGVRPSWSRFAEYLGVHPVTVGRWLKGQDTPSKSYRKKLAPKLGNGVYTKLDKTIVQRKTPATPRPPKPKAMSSEIESVAALFSLLPEDQKSIILGLMRSMTATATPTPAANGHHQAETVEEVLALPEQSPFDFEM